MQGAIAATLLALVLGTLLLKFLVGREPEVAITKREFREFPLAEKEQISHNTILLRFKLPKRNQRLGLGLGKHLSVMAEDDDGEELVRRPYTPTTLDNVRGHFDLVVKLYPAGKMSQHMKIMRVGERLKFRGPMGSFSYERNSLSHIGMVCGGTGITPMYQVLKTLLQDPEDTTQLRLIFGNVTEDDVLLREELDDLTNHYSERLKIVYVLDKPPAGWKGASGYVTADMMKGVFAPPGKGVKVLRCGPPPMNAAVAKALDSVGYTKEMQFEF